MGFDANLYIQKTTCVREKALEKTGFANVVTPLGWFTKRASDLDAEERSFERCFESFYCLYQRKEVETLAILLLGKAWGIYPFLEELLGAPVCDDYKIYIPDHKVLPMLYRLHEDCVTQKRYPDLYDTQRCDRPWLDIHGEIKEIQQILESIIDVTSPTQKFKSPEWEGFQWYWIVG